jgi:crotonobetainyl-CoA:carnitine CoA-transferase CaiB-like acyl-CoA transferase
VSNTQIFAGDFFAGMHGAIALLAALRHRRRTGEGQTIELSQLECSAQMFPQALLDAAWNGRVAATIGNRSIEGFVPNGVFPAIGDDRWIAISCRDDVEWSALVEAMGNPAWAANPALTSREGRAAAEEMIEERLATWTQDRDVTDLFHHLQAAGVTAGPVLNAGDAALDPHLEASEMWQALPATIDYPETKFHRPPYRFSLSNVGLRTPPAAFGEHNDYVYTDLLGLSAQEQERLRVGGHITDVYADEVLHPRSIKQFPSPGPSPSHGEGSLTHPRSASISSGITH